MTPGSFTKPQHGRLLFPTKLAKFKKDVASTDPATALVDSPERVWFDLQQAGELAGLRAGFFRFTGAGVSCYWLIIPAIAMMLSLL
jgi:hypothetical protein